ncbi:MAG: 1-acyl-sn-glycerol-3-phosphate acyltransferase [Candidatus Omnitrophica bacterium]|nr:1-acyl-sn-glycerol-3-phosphate acyltransferase [Candidatus Omnitrophota bacterium]
MFYWFAWSLVRFLHVIFFPLKIVGKENIPKKGAFILASNHQSYLDPMVIPISTSRRLNFIARDTLFKSRVMSWILRHLDVFPIKRNSSDVKAIRMSLNILKQDKPLLMFPEGTRKGHKEEKTVQPGIGLLATLSGVPVIPVYVSGSEKVLPPGSKSLRRHLIKVSYGKPIFFAKGKDYQHKAERIMQNIYALKEANL